MFCHSCNNICFLTDVEVCATGCKKLIPATQKDIQTHAPLFASQDLNQMIYSGPTILNNLKDYIHKRVYVFATRNLKGLNKP